MRETITLLSLFGGEAVDVLGLLAVDFMSRPIGTLMILSTIKGTGTTLTNENVLFLKANKTNLLNDKDSTTNRGHEIKRKAKRVVELQIGITEDNQNYLFAISSITVDDSSRLDGVAGMVVVVGRVQAIGTIAVRAGVPVENKCFVIGKKSISKRLNIFPEYKHCKEKENKRMK